MGGSEVKQGLPSRCSRVGTALPLAINMDRELCKLPPPFYTSSHISFWPSKEKSPFPCGDVGEEGLWQFSVFPPDKTNPGA